ncbi:hypothetical protein VNO77_23639 [Canavalia gladiata]|uniref:Uncharacterized protein n=1 Tax=Canavalia gladiata TaxID=3824 RepID=A0AAN9L4S3_CANGL
MVFYVEGFQPWEVLLIERAKTLKVNAGTEPDTNLNLVISKQAGIPTPVPTSIGKFTFLEFSLAFIASSSHYHVPGELGNISLTSRFIASDSIDPRWPYQNGRQKVHGSGLLKNRAKVNRILLASYWNETLRLEFHATKDPTHDLSMGAPKLGQSFLWVQHAHSKWLLFKQSHVRLSCYKGQFLAFHITPHHLTVSSKRMAYGSGAESARFLALTRMGCLNTYGIPGLLSRLGNQELFMH